MKLATRVLTSGLAAALALPAIAAAEDGEAAGTAAFESVDVTVDDGAILVNGVATFGGEFVPAGTDDTGDAGVPGADLSELAVQQDPASGELTFTMALADGLPTTGSLPVGVYYEWHIGIDGTDGVALRANFTEYDQPGGFVFSVTTFSTDPTTGNGSFTSADVAGEYTGSELVWHVAPAALGAKPGDVLVQGDRGPTRSGAGIAGFVTFPTTSYDEMFMEDFTVGGGARIVVRDAAGEEVDAVLAKVRRGEFSAAIDELAPGTYTVEVTTGYGDGATTETSTVTV